MYNQEWANKDYYSVLNLTKTATHEDINKSYRKLARKYHPDLNPGDLQVEKKFKEITEAYSVIGDESVRKQYDSMGSNPFSGFGGFGSSSMSFEDLLRNFDSGTTKTEPDINLDELLKHIREEDSSKSSVFSDMGDLFQSAKNATSSKVNDIFSRVRKDEEKSISIEMAFEKSLTPSTHEISNNGETVKIRIPAGIRDGQTVRIKNPVNATVKVHIKPTEKMYWDEKDLVVRVPVSLKIAINGGSVAFILPTGVETSLNLPELCANRPFRLTGKGVNGGNLIIRPYVSFPQSKTVQDLREQLIEEINN